MEPHDNEPVPNGDTLSAARTPVIDATAGFPHEPLGPVPLNEAADRILAYCTSRSSGWALYDLASISARSAGLLNEVTAWSLLFANALNGRVEATQLAEFDRQRRRDFADLVAAIPEDLDLARMTDGELDAVINACCFGFAGAWAAKITKLGALYRPRAIPVLDRNVGMAFGYQPGDLRGGGRDQRQRITKIVQALARYLRDHQATMALLRAEVSTKVPELAAAGTEELSLISDLRLLDMVMWTAVDDRRVTPTGKRRSWLGGPVGDHIPPAALAPEPIRPA